MVDTEQRPASEGGPYKTLPIISCRGGGTRYQSWIALRAISTRGSQQRKQGRRRQGQERREESVRADQGRRASLERPEQQATLRSRLARETREARRLAQCGGGCRVAAKCTRPRKRCRQRWSRPQRPSAAQCPGGAA